MSNDQFEAKRDGRIFWALRLMGVWLAIVVLLNALLSVPRRSGDGYEYALTTHAIATRGDAAVTATDVAEVTNLLRVWPLYGMSSSLLTDMAEAFAASKDRFGFYRTEGEKFYGYHFWLYPALTAPFEVALRSLGENPFKSMQVLNALVAGLVLIWLLGWQPASPDIRLWTGACYLLGGPIYYLRWTGPEVLVTSIIVLGFASLYVGRWRLALAGFALASLQVLSLAPLLALVWAHRWTQVAGSSRERFRILTKDWPWLLAFVVPLIAPLFYFWNFGKFNLIVTSGAASAEFISLGRQVSAWFDLDQGMIVGLPWLLPIVLLAVAGFVRRHVWDRELTWALAGSLIIFVPLTAQGNWNAGQAVFNRYALIAAAPLCVWMGRHLARRITMWPAGVVLLVIMLGWNAYFGGDEALEEDYLYHKPWTSWVLSHVPGLYHPEPEIFVERTLHREVSIRYGQLHAAVAWPVGAKTKTKILIPRAYGAQALSGLCPHGGFLADIDGKALSPEDAGHWQYGWGYLDGRMSCRPRPG
ncbi:MAG: hypothetical protein WAU52_13945 [Burkholderiales bacterium]